MLPAQKILKRLIPLRDKEVKHTGGGSIIEAFLSPECSDDYRAVQELALHNII